MIGDLAYDGQLILKKAGKPALKLCSKIRPCGSPHSI